MNEYPIIDEIHKYRVEHAEKYDHDIKRIFQALREAEKRFRR